MKLFITLGFSSLLRLTMNLEYGGKRKNEIYNINTNGGFIWMWWW